jgi:hypothetical protein
MPHCILCALEVSTLTKCKECSLESCEECIKDWYTKSNYSCPQCRRIRTFDVEIVRLPIPATPTVHQLEAIYGNQNFLGVTQQFGIYSVLSTRGPRSHDIHNTIPNPINVISPWANTSISAVAQNAPTFVASSLLPRSDYH